MFRRKIARIVSNDSVCLSCQISSENLMRCVSCKSAYYCSKQCQIDHWPIHSSECQFLGRLHDANMIKLKSSSKDVTPKMKKVISAVSQMDFPSSSPSHGIRPPSMTFVNGMPQQQALFHEIENAEQPYEEKQPVARAVQPQKHVSVKQPKKKKKKEQSPASRASKRLAGIVEEEDAKALLEDPSFVRKNANSRKRRRSAILTKRAAAVGADMSRSGQREPMQQHAPISLSDVARLDEYKPHSLSRLQGEGNLASSTDLQSHGSPTGRGGKIHHYVVHQPYLIARQQNLADAVKQVK